MIKPALMAALAFASLCASSPRKQASVPTDAAADPSAQSAAPATDAASAEASASVATGTPVDVALPLFFGGVQELADLRGRVVVLALSPSNAPGLNGCTAGLQAVQAAAGRGVVTVVLVATDATSDAFANRWDSDPPPFILGWDPQGAVPLRLGVSTLPAVLVFDKQGVLVGSVSGLSDDCDRVGPWVDVALAPRTN